ncbi:nitrogenase iron-molybdenum cofactor biosynthesis protein NifE [Nostoc sp. UCD121]|uniref:nitrogenase iron-molybdenum cofactor biosynthesis protein NifE n=1 Tax=unclassified Nostoc TaxID=2593658 RepID=UPI001624ACC6|nr:MULTISPECIES: nitrogenase iron-molybdenum cofactor biosynthesis protein NifE [unclassified Nostoc]MBC1221038.1 nitrogenase iron-molybdenum cofactor biosynthesis protein NifE [Nostoc sp. UCD120]MBC1278935.1 nitrogenase iron-molybdenum cofactor biosynthesis protein NifE [Nostoc sp. UCD121]MBC1293903.1 nitrogenase iron-molybdenum cofactor biosynthesis protein NifE [Nostoc sp. UCD122]
MNPTPGKTNDSLSGSNSEDARQQQIQKKKKSSTQLPQPGTTQGSCAFDSAMITLVPITDAAHVVHGPSGCAASIWGSHSSLSSGSMLYKIRFSSDIDENDIIFGGAKKLYKGILELQRRYKPAAVFVYSTCITALIGDDIEGVCKDATEKTGIPTIPVHCPGFIGNQNLGNRVAGEAMLSHVIGTAEPDTTTPYDINLIGEYNIAGAIWNILPLLEKLGIRVLAKITGDAIYKEVCYAHRAKLNVILSSKALINVAKRMEKQYGIPYIEESMYGIEQINQYLRNIAAKLGNSSLQERTEKLIAEETAAIDEKLAFYITQLQGKRVLLSIGSFKSWLIIFAAKKLEMEVIAISTNNNTEEDRIRVKSLLGQDGIILEQNSPQEILQIINVNQADMLIADKHHQDTSLTARLPFLDVNQERNHAYAGYMGILEVARELYAAFYTPVWEQVSQPAPWETGNSPEENI